MVKRMPSENYLPDCFGTTFCRAHISGTKWTCEFSDACARQYAANLARRARGRRTARMILAHVSLAHRPADLTRNAIAAAVGISPSRVSHHLRTLTLAGELDCRLEHVAGYRRRVRVWRREGLP